MASASADRVTSFEAHGRRMEEIAASTSIPGFRTVVDCLADREGPRRMD